MNASSAIECSGLGRTYRLRGSKKNELKFLVALFIFKRCDQMGRERGRIDETSNT